MCADVCLPNRIQLNRIKMSEGGLHGKGVVRGWCCALLNQTLSLR